MCVFAKQLQQVLAQHGKNFGQLYKIRVEEGGYNGRFVSAEQIKRLKQAVSDNCSFSTTLNRYELEAVQKEFSFKPEEIRRLRAALAAESILRFLLERIEKIKAIQISEAMFHLLFDADDSEFITLRSSMVNDIRNDNPSTDEEVTANQHMQNDLEPAIEIYENALLWLDTARMTQNPILRRGYIAMITSLLSSAQELLDYPSASVYGTLQLAEWRQSVEQAIVEMQDIKAM